MSSFSTIIENYHQFKGIHPETGSLYNALAHQGITPLASGEPLSEALLLGISGGISVLYFVFEYEGYEPHLYLGTRLASPTDEPVRDLCERLGLVARYEQTDSPAKAVTNLTKALAAGTPALVWANLGNLPYNTRLGLTEGMYPLVVYGYDEQADKVYLADRARVPLTCTTAELAAARAFQANYKNKLLTLAAPARFNELSKAVEEGIRACATVFLNGPAKGPKNNFGLASLLKWADLLTADKDKKGWPQLFPPGPRLYAALVSIFEYIETHGSGGGASRPMYASFLEEAGELLAKPEFKAAAGLFRQSGEHWTALAHALLPDSVSRLKESRELILRRDKLFVEQGMAALAERQAINERLNTIKQEIAASFPLTDSEVVTWREELRARVLKLQAVEREAAQALHEAITP